MPSLIAPASVTPLAGADNTLAVYQSSFHENWMLPNLEDNTMSVDDIRITSALILIWTTMLIASFLVYGVIP
jgi:hypothetical protein